MMCMACLWDNRVEAKFCADCGQDLSPGQPVGLPRPSGARSQRESLCAKCQEIVQARSRFCDRCGEAIRAQRATRGDGSVWMLGLLAFCAILVIAFGTILYAMRAH